MQAFKCYNSIYSERYRLTLEVMAQLKAVELIPTDFSVRDYKAREAVREQLSGLEEELERYDHTPFWEWLALAC